MSKIILWNNNCYLWGGGGRNNEHFSSHNFEIPGEMLKQKARQEGPKIEKRLRTLIYIW